MTKNRSHFDHVGSFLRPQELKTARNQYEANQLSLADYKTVQHEAIEKLVKKEVAVGLTSVTDGEFKPFMVAFRLSLGLNGVGKYEQTDSYKFHGAKTRTTNIELTSKVAYNPNHPFFEDFEFLKSILPPGIEPKVTIPSLR